MKTCFQLFSLPTSRLFLAFLFLLWSHFLTAQCGNQRLDIYATYSVSQTNSFVLQIAGGFDAKVYSSQRFRFIVTLQRVPDPLVTSFKIDFGNGQSQTLNFTQADLPITRSFDVDYTSLSDKLVNVSTLPGTASLTQTLKLSTNRALRSGTYRTPTRTDRITGASFSPTCLGFLPVAKDGLAGTASIYAHTLLSPSNPTGRVRRPLIFVEGIDFGTEIRCDPNLQGIDRTVGIGDFGWDNFITGVFQDPDDLDNETFGQINPLVQRMLNDGYDIVFCDFADGADWIQKNGLALIEVINFVNREKRAGTPIGTCYPNIVVGASMGGQVAKWALRTMENQGINHDAALYVSFDSPQQGANVALAVQSFIWFNANYGSVESRAKILPRWKALNRPAAQQLIVHHFNRIEQTNGCDLRQQFADEMIRIGGYPSRTRNIATANGSGFGIGQGYASTALLAHFKATARVNVGRSPTVINTSILAADINLSASGAPLICDVTQFSDATIGTNIITGMHANLNYYNLGIVPIANSNKINVLVTSQTKTSYLNPLLASTSKLTTLKNSTLTFNSNFRNLDNAPGGNRQDIARSLKKELETALMGQNFENLPTGVPAGVINAQTFIPSISALDIQTSTDNVNIDIFSAIGGNPLSPASNITPFAAVFFPAQNQTPKNENHVQISTLLGNFIITQMQAAQVALQSPLAEPYNYGLVRTIVPSVTVANGGILGINNNGFTGYVNRTTREAAANQTTFKATATSTCNANIVVQSGGKLQLGAGWANAGVLHINAGSSLTLQAGSTTEVNNLSQIVVETGGRLVIDAGANINLTGSESTIFVKSGGELVLNGGLMKVVGNGFFQFDAGHKLALPATGLSLSGTSKTTRMIRLNASPQNTFNKMVVRGAFSTINALVEYGNNRCGIDIFNTDASQINFVRVSTFRGTGSGSALNFVNAAANVAVTNCDFINLTEGINIVNTTTPLSTARIQTSNFNLVSNAITINTPANTSYDFAPSVSSCTFNYVVNGTSIGSGTACKFLNMPEPVSVSSCTFTGSKTNSVYENLTAIELQNATLSMSSSKIMDFKTGISAEKQMNNNVSLSNNAEINGCETGINMVGGSTSNFAAAPYGNVNMTCSKLINNITGIRGTDVRLGIDVRNHFQNLATNTNSALRIK